MLQVPRIAEARKLPVDKVQSLVTDNTLGASLFSERTLNVLRLNLALDAASGGAQGPAASNFAPVN